MNEHPIIFSAPMIRPLVAGKKTQTRRLASGRSGTDWKCGYGGPGDRLWVRESFALKMMTPPADDYLYGPIEGLGIRKYGGGGPPPNRYDARRNGDNVVVTYRCNPRTPEELRASPGFNTWSGTGDEPKSWRSPIYMPRWCSRINLEIISVRLQRLHEITEEDARAEGVAPRVTLAKVYPSARAADVEHESYVGGFEDAWAKLHDYGSWLENPWVWAIEFKKLKLHPSDL